jgi:hypothetical protein
MEFLKYNITPAQIYVPNGINNSFIQRVPNCNGMLIVNTGDSIVTVNGQPLYPGIPGTSLGDSLPIGGNAGELFTGNVQLIFGAGATPEVTVTQKFYVMKNQC